MARCSPRRLNLPRHAAIVFLSILFAYGYVFPRWADWNQNSRFDLTRALVEGHTVAIDRYAANTGDYATVNGRIVSDKAPGLSLLAVPPYALVLSALRTAPARAALDRVAHRDAFVATLNVSGSGLQYEKTETALALAFVTFVCVAIPSALLGVLLTALFRRFSPYEGANAAIAITLMLATPLAAYGNAFYGHAPVAVILFAAFSLLVTAEPILSRARLAGLGALYAAALMTEYPSALVVAGLGIWTIVSLWRARVLPRIGWLALGGVPFLALLARYDLAAYGTLLPTGYEHSTLWQDRHSEGFLSLTYPKPDALWGITFGDFRGLFTLTPVLLLAVPGFVCWWRRGTDRGAWWVALWSVTSFLIFNGASVMWSGGFAVGPRYLLPVLPFLCYAIGALIPALVRRWQLAVGFVALTAVSTVQVWAHLLAGQGYPPDTMPHPLVQYVLPRLAAGDVARNLGMALGLRGLWSLVPLLIVLLALIGWQALRARVATRETRGAQGLEASYVRA